MWGQKYDWTRRFDAVAQRNIKVKMQLSGSKLSFALSEWNVTSCLVSGEVRDRSFISSRAGCGGKHLSLRLNFHGSILKLHKIWNTCRPGVLCKSCQTIIIMMPANPVFFKSGQVNSRPATKFYPYRIIEPTVLDCTKLPGHPPMYLRKVSHHTECFLTKLGPYAHTHIQKKTYKQEL